MKIAISGREYDVAAIGKMSLFDLLELKKQTGLSVDDLQAAFSGVESDDDGASLLGSSDGLMALGALIWLTRRKAGEVLTLEQACDFPLEEMQMINDEPEPAAETVNP